MKGRLGSQSQSTVESVFFELGQCDPELYAYGFGNESPSEVMLALEVLTALFGQAKGNEVGGLKEIVNVTLVGVPSAGNVD